MPEYIHALTSGTVLADYRIERILGEGGFGITYLARDDTLRKAYAIKEYLPDEFAVRVADNTVLPKSSSSKVDFAWGMERFLDEARTLATFDHPNLNQVYRFFEANGTAYMVLAYEKGETLAQRLNRCKILPEADVLVLLRALLSGLSMIHEKSVIHRDIKPNNIIIREDGTPVLLDFGAARAAIGHRSKSITSILTPGYAPVEQYDLTSDDLGPWTDLYALGMVAYRCVTGLANNELLDAIARARLQRKGELDKDIVPATILSAGKYSPALLRAIDHAIQIDEEARPQSASALLAELSGDEATIVDSPRSVIHEAPMVESAPVATPATPAGGAEGQATKVATSASAASSDVPAVQSAPPAKAPGAFKIKPRYVLAGLAAVVVIAAGIILALHYGSARPPEFDSTQQQKVTALRLDGKIEALSQRLAQVQQTAELRARNSPELEDLLNAGVFNSAARAQLIAQHKAAQSLINERRYKQAMTIFPTVEQGYMQLLQNAELAETLNQQRNKVSQIRAQWLEYAKANGHEQEPDFVDLDRLYNEAQTKITEGAWPEAVQQLTGMDEQYSQLLESWKQQDDPEYQKRLQAQAAYEKYKRDLAAAKQQLQESTEPTQDDAKAAYEAYKKATSH